MAQDAPGYRRILLKLSGELLADNGNPFDREAIGRVAEAVKGLTERGIQVAIVCGGGNLVRGRDHQGSHAQIEVDHIGMLATVVNVGLLRLHLQEAGLSCSVYAPRAIHAVAETFRRQRAIADLEAGRVVLLGGGTGNPCFSTDSAAALRSIELDCDAILKGTNVDGIYDKDPNQHPDAVRFDHLTHDEAIQRGLQVMDQAAFALCRDRGMRVVVFDLRVPQNLVGLIDGTVRGTVVSQD